MKRCFVALSLFVFVCATGICQAQNDEVRTNMATASVWNIDFLEPSPRLANFVISQRMQNVCLSRKETNTSASSFENKPITKRHRLWHIIAESCLELLGEITTDVVHTELKDKTTETGDSITSGFDF